MVSMNVEGDDPANMRVVDESPFPLTDIDKWVLSQTDEKFHLHNWEELKNIIAQNRLETLKRKPSDLRRYIAWSQQTKAHYGSIRTYLLVNRLPSSWGTPPFTFMSPVPFHDSSDYKILRNDWPYGMEQNITHIVVWSKTPIETESQNGDVTEKSRRIIETFVDQTFAQRVGKDGSERVVWFKNWVRLQSVRALEHVHILVKDASSEDLEFWTGEKV